MIRTSGTRGAIPLALLTPSGDGYRTQQEIPVTKVYIVMLFQPYLLESGETWEKIVVSGVFMSRNAADEYIDYHEPSLPFSDRYSIREELVKS